MHDQVTALRQLGIRAAALNSSLTNDERMRVRADPARRAAGLDLCRARTVDAALVRWSFWTARRLRCSPSTKPIASASVGHDFRPEYMKLEQLGERFPRRSAHRADGRPADPQTQGDIRAGGCAWTSAKLFLASFDRPNISLRHRAEGRSETAAACLHQRRAHRRKRHRLLPEPRQGRRPGRLADATQGGERAALSCRAGCRCPAAATRMPS